MRYSFSGSYFTTDNEVCLGLQLPTFSFSITICLLWDASLTPTSSRVERHVSRKISNSHFSLVNFMINYVEWIVGDDKHLFWFEFSSSEPSMQFTLARKQNRRFVARQNFFSTTAALSKPRYCIISHIQPPNLHPVRWMILFIAVSLQEAAGIYWVPAQTEWKRLSHLLRAMQ